MNYKVDLRTASWTGILQNYELFDHQDLKGRVYQRFDVKEPVRVSQNPTTLKIITSSIKSKLVGIPLFELTLDPECMVVRPLQKDGCTWSIYQLVPSDKVISEFRVKKGDVLKLGLQTVTFIQIYRTPKTRPETLHYTKSALIVSEYESEKTMESARSLESSKFQTAELDNMPICRVCLRHTSSPTNPIAKVCNCMGSSKFIHFKCLEIWLRERLVITPCKSKYVVALSKKGSKCEICQSYYDFRALLQIGMSESPSNYCVVDVSTDKQNIYLLDFSSTTQLVVGRGHHSDLSINDETVSRKHCKILFDDLKCRFYVVDLDSKFGTLAASDKKPTEEQYFKDSVILQVDRHVISLEKIKKKSLFDKVFKICSYQTEEAQSDQDDNQGWLRQR